MSKKPSRKLIEDQETSITHQLTEHFWIIGPAFTRWAESHMNQPGLTPQRMRLLILLLKNGPMMMSSIRDEMGVTATNITAMVDALENDGMVARKRHPSDRRAILIEITSKAENQLTENCSDFKDKVSELFSGFSEMDQKQFLTFLQRTKEALIERGVLNESDIKETDNCSKTESTYKKSI